MPKRWVPDRRDIIWIDFDPQTGREMKARHPMLVLSPRIVNDPTSIVIGLPMSTADYNATNPFAVPLVGNDGTTGYVISNQPKSFDWRERKAKAHPWKQAPEDVFESACDKLNRIISICCE
ncbi:type II toxin-antitoxin system PemK/MazF family toxin [Pseudomarimonas arenosa]|uniref:Type II toxin-antitoxin system PemK/MazF family toxin n=1 Tax=Pseudomarimonas arenosa TaxID=2774145 RepID=A0AAW3ZJN0_9GAMM|nr:type II toxin-antitoxin system PemK/MazF family toxin [Pseudomarimonas arenosa]MBD8524666.1 type II toxin-antitoxin system PemK/MazF family toxin [Pseudomarimonas arenosa]